MMSQVAHLPFYLADPRCEVLRVAESRPSLIAALGKQLGPDRIVADHGALLEDATIAALVISAPRPATGPLTLAALAAGKHVMTEKPMAHTVEQAQRLVDAATARGLIYAVGFMKRYDPGVQAAKTLIDETVRAGRLGRMLFARFYDYSNAYGMSPPAHVRPQESRTLRFATWPIFPDWLPERLRGAYAWFLNVAGHDVNLVRFFFPHDVDVLDAHCPSDGSVVATLQAGTVPIALEIAKTAAGRWLEGAEFLFERWSDRDDAALADGGRARGRGGHRRRRARLDGRAGEHRNRLVLRPPGRGLCRRARRPRPTAHHRKRGARRPGADRADSGGRLPRDRASFVEACRFAVHGYPRSTSLSPRTSQLSSRLRKLMPSRLVRNCPGCAISAGTARSMMPPTDEPVERDRRGAGAAVGGVDVDRIVQHFERQAGGLGGLLGQHDRARAGVEHHRRCARR